MPEAHDLSTPLAWALAYAQIGWHVLPLEPRQKQPLGRLVPRGMLDATTDLQTIRTWWIRHPNAGIGIALAQSGLVAIDVDPRNGGTETFEQLQAEHGSLRSDVMAFTGGGGEHHVFVVPHGHQVSLPGTLGPGVDVKANGYIVAEPSIHPSGKAYGWEGMSNPLDGVVPSPLPDWLRNLRVRPQEAARDDAGRVVTGGRNEHLSRRAFLLRKAGMRIEHIADVLLRINADECSPPLPEDEVRTIAQRKAIVQPDPQVYVGGVTPLPSGLVLTLDQLHQKAGSLRWAVKGVVPERSIGFIYGASGTFKSFLALDYALHRAYGMKWLGRRTKQAVPVYLAAEGGAGLMRRIEAWHKDRGMVWQDCPMRVVIVPMTLRTQAADLCAAIQAVGVHPGDLIVDTMSQTFTGNENSNDEVADFLRVIGMELRDAMNCTVTVVHHSGHSATERPRGASAIIANVDFCFGVFRDEKEMLCTLEFVKVKDGDRPEEQRFEMASVELGFDEDGDVITSLSARHLVDPAEVQAAMAREALAGRGGKNSLLVQLSKTCTTEKELRKVFYDECGLANQDSRKHAYANAKRWALSNKEFEIVEGLIIIPRGSK
jgi:hypothetical protein